MFTLVVTDIHASVETIRLAKKLGVTRREAAGYILALHCWTNKNRFEGWVQSQYIDDICE